MIMMMTHIIHDNKLFKITLRELLLPQEKVDLLALLAIFECFHAEILGINPCAYLENWHG